MSDNKVRSLWHRLTRSQEVAEAEELQERLRRMEVMGARPIAQCAVGDAVTISGVVQALSLRPRATVPALEIDVYDGSGRVRVVWLGRRMIPGIDAGRPIVITGRLTQPDGVPTIYNPRYQLLPRAA